MQAWSVGMMVVMLWPKCTESESQNRHAAQCKEPWVKGQVERRKRQQKRFLERMIIEGRGTAGQRTHRKRAMRNSKKVLLSLSVHGHTR